MLLPKGARVVFQLHYHNAQLAAQSDLTELRPKAAKGPVQKKLHFWITLTAAWDKPPRDAHWGERTVDEMGHAHAGRAVPGRQSCTPWTTRC